MGYEQPIPLFYYMYSGLALGVLPSSIHQKKPMHGLQLFLTAAVWLVLPLSRLHLYSKCLLEITDGLICVLSTLVICWELASYSLLLFALVFFI